MEDQIRSLLPSSISLTTDCTQIWGGAAVFCVDRQHVDLRVRDGKGYNTNFTVNIISLQKNSSKAIKE